MINDWKKQLSAKGFEKIGRKDFFRRSPPASALIYETPLRVGERKVRLNLAVEILDPWEEERDYHVIDVKGDVTPEGIYVHYDDSATWLEPEEKDQVWAVLEKCMDGWLDYWTNPHHLIEYFESPTDIVMTRYSHDGICEHITGVPAKRRDSPNAAHLLSLLYYHVEDFPKALSAAQRYWQFIGSTTAYIGEPDRTRRQIEALSLKVDKSKT